MGFRAFFCLASFEFIFPKRCLFHGGLSFLHETVESGLVCREENVHSLGFENFLEDDQSFLFFFFFLFLVAPSSVRFRSGKALLKTNYLLNLDLCLYSLCFRSFLGWLLLDHFSLDLSVNHADILTCGVKSRSGELHFVAYS